MVLMKLFGGFLGFLQVYEGSTGFSAAFYRFDSRVSLFRGFLLTRRGQFPAYSRPNKHRPPTRAY